MIIYGVDLSLTIEDWVRLFLFWSAVIGFYCLLFSDFFYCKLNLVVANTIFYISLGLLIAFTIYSLAVTSIFLLFGA